MVENIQRNRMRRFLGTYMYVPYTRKKQSMFTDQKTATLRKDMTSYHATTKG